MGRKSKNCYTKVRESKKRFIAEIQREQVLLYNWRKHKHELRPDNQTMKEHQIEALQNSVNKLIIIYNVLNYPIKHHLEKVKYNKCLKQLETSIKRIQQIITEITYEMNEWRDEKHLIPRDDYFFMKSIDLQRKLELREYLESELILLQRKSLKEEPED